MSKRFRRANSLWLIAALLSAVIACSGEGKVNGPVLSSPRQPLIGGGGTDAGVGGEVVYDAGVGCLYLGNGDVRTPVVWPHGASWQEEPPAVKLRGRLIEPGMSVKGSGGHLSHETIRELAGDSVADAARACALGSNEIAFFNRGSKVDVLSD